MNVLEWMGSDTGAFVLYMVESYHRQFAWLAYTSAVISLIAFACYAAGWCLSESNTEKKHTEPYFVTTLDVVYGAVRVGLAVHFWPFVLIYKASQKK